MDTKHIVAIDAGSSKIALAVGFESDNGFRISFYKALPSSGINHGRIQNAQQASEVIRELVGAVKEELGLDVMQAIINLPSHPIVQINAKSTLQREEDTIVREEDIRMLRDQACEEALREAADRNEKNHLCIFDCVTQSYSDGMDFLIGEDDIIGRFSEEIEGYYRVFLGRNQPMSNIDNTLGLLDLTSARKYFSPQYTGKIVLDRTDMENGVALIDIGGGVTSVSIFTGGILRYYDSIPFGGRAVTMDIRNECGLSEALAENIKKVYGICCPDKLQNMSDKYLRIKLRDASRTKEVGIKFLSEIVTARMKEIFEAALYIIQESGMADDLGAGIVLTGGGAKLFNCSKLLEEQSGYSVRVGQVNSRAITMPAECLSPDAAGCLGLLFAGRGLDKVWFVNDPADPRINAIDTEKKTDEETEQETARTEESTDAERDVEPAAEEESASGVETKDASQAVPEPRPEATDSLPKAKKTETNLFGETVPEKKMGLKKPHNHPKDRGTSLLDSFGAKILGIMDGGDHDKKKDRAKTEDLFGDNLFGDEL